MPSIRPSPELEILAWKVDGYLKAAEEGPPFFVQIKSILSQACRLRAEVPCKHEGQVLEAWLTLGLTRVRHFVIFMRIFHQLSSIALVQNVQVV